MKIVCVGSYCAGALICDLLNGEASPFETSVIQNRFNHTLKVGPDDKFLHLVLPTHLAEWEKLTTRLVGAEWTEGKAFGHHQPIFLIPNLDIFEEVYNITTTTMKSRWYRFLRHYWIEINGQKMMQEYSMDNIKGMINIIKHDPSWLPVEGPNITNIEFEDVVSGKWCEETGGDMKHMATWRRKNKFILDDFEQDPALVELWETQEQYYMDPDWEEMNGRPAEFYRKVPPLWEVPAINRINSLLDDKNG